MNFSELPLYDPNLIRSAVYAAFGIVYLNPRHGLRARLLMAASATILSALYFSESALLNHQPTLMPKGIDLPQMREEYREASEARALAAQLGDKVSSDDLNKYADALEVGVYVAGLKAGLDPAFLNQEINQNRLRDRKIIWSSAQLA